MDVKYVPEACYAGREREKFYQYTMLEEASRERFIYAYRENSNYSTVDFVKRAIIYFGYAPEVIQTDNGAEFTHTARTDCVRPRTPGHNGKAERSHRNDQERFYNYLRFYSYDDLQEQMKRCLRRANRILMAALGWKLPLQKQQELEAKTAKF